MASIFKIVLTITFCYLSYIIYTALFLIPPLPLFEEIYWGKNDISTEDDLIKPFKVDVSKKILDDLKERLNNAIPLQPPLEGVRHHYGINSNLLQKIVNYWKNDYNWTARQQFLNQYPQFTVKVQGLKIHYIHVKPKLLDKKLNNNITILPLLMLHGWPGSVREFYEIIPYLTVPQKGRNFVFEVFAPSLPGYGFSEATHKPGLSASRMAQLFKNFMNKLKFDKFYVQGGDWGGIIHMYMSALYPENILGSHINICNCLSNRCNLKLWLLGTTFPSLIAEKEEIPYFTPYAERSKNLLLLEMGYAHIQATKPDTIGVGLRDSPVGLAAYIIEKFITWTNNEWKDLEDGGLTKKFTYDQLLDNVMIYWITTSITTSQRLYAETMNKNFFSSGLEEIPIKVPTACARFKNELMVMPESILKMRFLKLVQATLFNDGGHFAAFEEPHLLAEDIYNFVEKIL